MKRKRSRNTVQKEIEKQNDVESATELARFGRRLSPIERATAQYLLFRDAHDEISERCKKELSAIIFRAIDGAIPMRHTMTPVERAAQIFNSRENEVANVVFQSELESCVKTLKELADFVGSFGITPNPHDTKRTKLLTLKSILEDMGDAFPKLKNQITLAKVAEFLKEPKTDDGNAALRRLCKKLGLPLAKAEKTNKSKSDASKS